MYGEPGSETVAFDKDLRRPLRMQALPPPTFDLVPSIQTELLKTSFY